MVIVAFILQLNLYPKLYIYLQKESLVEGSRAVQVYLLNESEYFLYSKKGKTKLQDFVRVKSVTTQSHSLQKKKHAFNWLVNGPAH